WCDGRAVLYGGSYGGYMTLMGLSRQPELWKAGVDLAGPANLLSFMSTTTAEIRAVFIDEFGDPDKDRAFLESISPLHDVGRIVAPLFVYQGANDPRVPEAEAGQVVAALRARRVPVEYMLVANEGHSVEHIENHSMFLARAAPFLERSSAAQGPPIGSPGGVASGSVFLNVSAGRVRKRVMVSRASTACGLGAAAIVRMRRRPAAASARTCGEAAA